MAWGRAAPGPAALAGLLALSCSYGELTLDAGRDAVRRDARVGEDAETGDADRADAEVDAGMDAGGGPEIQVGGGAFEFEPLQSGQVVELITGPQGGGRYLGFHIWSGARTWDLDPTDMSAKFIVLHAGDRTELGRLEWVTSFRAGPDRSFEIWGATPRLLDCCAAVDQPLLMRIELLDRDGVSASAELPVQGGPSCTDPTGDLCP
jgi:hypothetical protein